MKNLFMAALAVSMGFSSFAQSVDQKKGVFEKVIVQPTKVGSLKPIYGVNPSEMMSQWKSNGFHLQGGSLVTGKYHSNSNCQIVSPSILLPERENGGRIYIRLNEKYFTESRCDYVRVLVSEDGGANYKSLCRRSGVSDEYDEYIDVTSYAGKEINVKLALVADGSYEGEGWSINQFEILMTSKPKSAPGIPSNIDLTSSISNLTYLGYAQIGYPKKLQIYFSARSANETFVEGLVKENLNVKVDGSTVESSCLRLQRLSNFNQMPVQIGLLMDNSGSMQDDIEGVAKNVGILINKIGTSMNASAGIFRLGFTGSSCPKDFKEAFDNRFLIPLNKDANRTEFLGVWNGQEAQGSYEPYYSCLYDMIDKQASYWDGMAQKVIILIGDETALYDNQNDYDCSRGVTYQLSDKEELISSLKENGFQVFTIINNSLTRWDEASNQYVHDESFDDIASSTGGCLIDIEKNNGYDEIFDKISSYLKERYVLEIDMAKCVTPDPVICPSVEISVNGVNTNGKVCPKEQASVERTPSTILYDTKGVQANSDKEKVGVMVTNIPNGQSVESVEVRMRVHKEQGDEDQWEVVIVRKNEDDGWYAAVPAEMLSPNAVIEYRFDVKMNDGNYLLLSPYGVEPDYWTISVLPNTPPSFGIPNPVISGEVCQPIDICVDLTDDGSIKEAHIKYRGINSVDNFMDAPLTKQGSQYCGEIPARYSVAPGFEYYLVATDDKGATSYKGTSEQPIKKEISDVFEFQSSDDTEEVAIMASQYVDCGKLAVGDEVFVYFKTDCTDEYYALGGYAKIDDPNNLKAIISLNTGERSYKDGIDYGDDIIVKLKRQGLLYDITNPNNGTYTGMLNVVLPEIPRFVLKGNWNEITNGQQIVSTKDNTNFGFAKTPVEYQYVIENYSGCGDISNIKISIENTEKAEVSDHFTVSKDFTEVPNWKSATFSIKYDAGEDEDAIVKIEYGAGNVFEYAISGREAVEKEECKGITFINPVNQQNHVIYINVEEKMNLYVYAVDQEGKLLASLYNGEVSPNPYHGIDLYNVMNMVAPGKAFFVVVEREGKASCTQTIFVDNKN